MHLKSNNCDVCKEAASKYRCPQCHIVYCSVPCYKTHKTSEDCKPQPGKPTSPNNDTENMLTVSHVSRSINVGDFHLNEDEAGDRVPQECLHRLRDSPELKLLLDNPHLRDMMTGLVSSTNQEKDMEKAMQEPIFTEFADVCLAMVSEGDTKG